MKKIISLVLSLSIWIMWAPISLGATQVEELGIVKASILSSSEVGEDIKFKVYHYNFHHEKGEIQLVYFLDEEGVPIDEEVEYSDFSVMSGPTRIDGRDYKGIEFMAPENLGINITPKGYIGIYTGDKYYFAPYELDNYLYPTSYSLYPNNTDAPPYNFLVPGQIGMVVGYNLSENRYLYIGESKTKDYVLYEDRYGNDDVVYFTVPSDTGSGYQDVRFTGDYTNKTSLYVAPNIADDPLQLNQWYLVQSKIYDAYEGYAPEEVVVAVIDSGVDIDHDDLAGSIWRNHNEVMGNSIDDDNNGYIDDVYGWTYRYEDFEMGSVIDPSGVHGTYVAGIIAAEQDNGEGILGIASNTKIMSLDVGTADGGISRDYIIDAIYYAADNGADIINISLGGAVYNTYTTEYDDAIEYAYKKGCMIVVAAGNGITNTDINADGVNMDNVPASPVCNDGNYDMVLGVAAVDGNGYLTSFSNYGEDCIDLSALGKNVYSTTWASEGDYSYNDGTSFSAPIVAGVAAMIKGQFPELENWEIQYLLEETASDVNDKNVDYIGKIGGLLDALSAFENAEIMSYPSRPAILGTSGLNSIFDDVDDSNQYYDAIKYVRDAGIVEGYSDGSYKPSNSINRAEFSKILIEAKLESDIASYVGSACLSDVIAGEWYSKYVCYAKESGIIGGYPDGTFKPAQYINIAEALKITLETYFDSIPEVNGEWYQKYWDYAENNGYLMDSWEDASTYLTRGEMAELIYRVEN